MNASSTRAKRISRPFRSEAQSSYKRRNSYLIHGVHDFSLVVKSCMYRRRDARSLARATRLHCVSRRATTSDADTVLYGASVGVSIPFEIGDWRISIKPSARYLKQKINFTGIVLDAEREVFPGLPPTITVQLYGDDSLDVHAVGPGLEIEVDAARVGSLSASVFISGGAYNVLSDRSVSFSNTVQDNQGEGVYRGFWTAKIDPWIYRANAGFRVKWLGFSSGWLGRGD